MQRLFSAAFETVVETVTGNKKPRLTCSEHFHTPSNTDETMHPCTSGRHKETYWVCKACVNESATWTFKPTPRGQPVEVQRVLQAKAGRMLCLHYTSSTIQRVGLGHSHCKCISVEPTKWLCFECRDILHWAGRTAKADVQEIERRENRRRRETGEGEAPLTLCPSCNNYFQPWNIITHAVMCLGCKGVRTVGCETHEVAIHEFAKRMRPFSSAVPMISARQTDFMPKYTGGMYRDEDIAPDEFRVFRDFHF